MRRFNSHTLVVIIISIALGFLSGIIGFAFASSYGNSLPFWGRINFSNITPDGQIIIDQPRSVVVEQDTQVKQVINNAVPALVNIYRSKNSQNIVDSAYLSGEVLGQGLVLTADGWIITTKSVVSSFTGNYVAIGYQNKQYKLTDFVEDKTTGLVFAKMDTRDLSVVRMSSAKSLTVGQTLVVSLPKQGLTIANVVDVGYNFATRASVVQSSEELNKEILLNIALNDDYEGGAVMNFKGEVIGLIVDGKVVPVDYFLNIVGQVLSDQTISRPILGVNYIDLIHTPGLVDVGEKGALIYGNILPVSPAYGQLKAGDIVIKVNDVELNASRSLSELLQNYKSGNTVDLEVLRDGETIKIDINLS